MSNDIDFQNKPNNNKVLAGLVLLAVGGVLLMKQLFYMPGWLISWPMLIIAWGLYSGSKHNFRNPTWIILIFVGVIFLLHEINNKFQAGEIVWPAVLIIFGLWMILRRNHRWDKWDKKSWENKWDWRTPPPPTPSQPDADPAQPVADPAASTVPPNRGYKASHTLGDDYLDTVSVFGGVKKTILSKDFKGGEIVNIFGGAELDFTQADISGKVTIDITQIFGGTKIIVPSNWQVVSDIAAVFASVDDKRLRSTAGLNNDKILVLKGVSIFAGVEIRSY